MRFRASDIGARRSTWLAWALLAAVTGAPAPQARAQSLPKPPRLLLPADADWRFARGDFATAAMPAFDDTKWTRVDLPHDWSADGPFSADLGSGNGYAPGGIAWYRKHLKLTADPSGSGAITSKRVNRARGWHLEALDISDTTPSHVTAFAYCRE